jgi:hypothetical protein
MVTRGRSLPDLGPPGKLQDCRLHAFAEDEAIVAT